MSISTNYSSFWTKYVNPRLVVVPPIHVGINETMLTSYIQHLLASVVGDIHVHTSYKCIYIWSNNNSNAQGPPSLALLLSYGRKAYVLPCHVTHCKSWSHEDRQAAAAYSLNKVPELHDSGHTRNCSEKRKNKEKQVISSFLVFTFTQNSVSLVFAMAKYTRHFFSVLLMNEIRAL